MIHSCRAATAALVSLVHHNISVTDTWRILGRASSIWNHNSSSDFSHLAARAAVSGERCRLMIIIKTPPVGVIRQRAAPKARLAERGYGLRLSVEVKHPSGLASEETTGPFQTTRR